MSEKLNNAKRLLHPWWHDEKACVNVKLMTVWNQSLTETNRRSCCVSLKFISFHWAYLYPFSQWMPLQSNQIILFIMSVLHRDTIYAFEEPCLCAFEKSCYFLFALFKPFTKHKYLDDVWVYPSFYELILVKLSEDLKGSSWVRQGRKEIYFWCNMQTQWSVLTGNL